MFKWIKRLWAKPIINVGDIYYSGNDPFARMYYEVVELKEGYVMYSYALSIEGVKMHSRYNSCKISTFLSMNKKYKEE